MALEIKRTPTLSGKAAEKFMKQVRSTEDSRNRIDFSDKVEKARRILKNTKLY